MEVKLLAHTQLKDEFIEDTGDKTFHLMLDKKITDGQVVALSAIRTCYSHNKPSEILEVDGEKYFGLKASDGASGTDADRLFRHIVSSGHTSTLEHITFTFSIEGVSRSLLAQLTRHRHFSYSVQSQRYVKLESDSKSGGFEYVIPPTINDNEEMTEQFHLFMEMIQEAYDNLREFVPAEDARYILPNAATCNLVLTGNLRSILDFYGKRSSKQAQWEIRKLAEKIKEAVIDVEPWTEQFFNKER